VTTTRAGIRDPGTGARRGDRRFITPDPGRLTADPGEPPAVALAQIVTALERRRERRRESAGELKAALGALADAVARHTKRVEEVRRAVEAHGGNLEALQFYDSIMARFRSELRAAERALADVFRVAAHGGSAPV
jgi:hypothetical protein